MAGEHTLVESKLLRSLQLMHTYMPYPMSLPVVNLLNLRESKKYPRQNFKTHGQKLMVTMTMSKVKSSSQNVADTYTTPNQCPYQVSTSYSLRFPRYSPDKIFKLKVTTARLKVISRHTITLHTVARLLIQIPWVKTITREPKSCLYKSTD